MRKQPTRDEQIDFWLKEVKESIASNALKSDLLANVEALLKVCRCGRPHINDQFEEN